MNDRFESMIITILRSIYSDCYDKSENVSRILYKVDELKETISKNASVIINEIYGRP